MVRNLLFWWMECQLSNNISQWFKIPSFHILYLYTLKKAMASHSSTFAWKIPWMEEPGGLQSMGLLRVRHYWATSLSLFTFMHWRRKWQPTPVFLPGGSQGREAWWATIYGVAQSRTRLKRLSSSSSSIYILTYVGGYIGMYQVSLLCSLVCLSSLVYCFNSFFFLACFDIF